ncbi:MerR family transcriptional regulator [Methylomicrobium sp. Wu6]|uniref:MerR family transcriptional regulator n=1 Tax=Methylomicrobium sp. Wu6 TaxID=3107928 RepID=UPI002DD666EB|nr:MerR family transcriptional regulator [Methylomicrobium sp. Wu6]MEC4748147.1 MerR family transcriptional regulator [Methylomicrobium sp. Wu6]
MTDIKDNSGQYLISTVSKRSGVKTELVRAWERRYQAVVPTRTAGGHRVYTDQDIARLTLLNQATRYGHSISRIARYSLDELRKLLQGEKAAAPAKPLQPLNGNGSKSLAEAYIHKCYAEVTAFDARTLESLFENAIVELGIQNFIEDLLDPLLTLIGERWKTGELRPVHEHMASSIIRSLTYILRNNSPCSPAAPRMVVTTPLGQLHELGALLAAIIAELKGWQVTYLGANLPAEEIAAAVKFTDAAAVTISISFSSDDHVVQKELRRLRKLLGYEVALIVGGRAASYYETVLNEVGVVKIENLAHFRRYLDDLANQKDKIPTQETTL